MQFAWMDHQVLTILQMQELILGNLWSISKEVVGVELKIYLLLLKVVIKEVALILEVRVNILQVLLLVKEYFQITWKTISIILPKFIWNIATALVTKGQDLTQFSTRAKTFTSEDRTLRYLH